MTDPAGSDLVDWSYLNPEGRRRLLERERSVNAETKSIAWDWDATPFNRVALINAIVRHWPDCRYLEIGCDKDELFRALPIDDKTGVDPASGGTLRMTSDEFFATNDRPFDLIFIDGLHTYAQVRKDIINSLSALAPGGWIGIHDLLPRNWKEQNVPRVQSIWTGDVWKIAFELIKATGIEFRIVLIDHGVGLVRRSGSEPPEIPDLGAELEQADFSHFYRNHETLPLIGWSDALAWITDVNGDPTGKSANS